MNILVTGAKGFIGKNLVEWLKQCRPDDELFLYDVDTSEDLETLCRHVDFVYHLAGVNRPCDIREFETGNKVLTEQILEYCKHGKKPPIVLSSSTQAELDNNYGISKKASENAVFVYGDDTGSPVYVYRLPGVFGKWCRPNYNSVVATFCHNIANSLPIEVHDPDYELNLVYIDDVCRSFLQALDDKTETNRLYCVIDVEYKITLGKLAEALKSFCESRTNLQTPDMSNELTKKLYSTYLSYLPDFSYSLATHSDTRGSFVELLKSFNVGQVSVNITRPGFTKGNHWHHTKAEKFVTVSGQGIMCLHKVGENEIIEHPVNGDSIKVIDVPPGYVHSLVNTGDVDLVTIIWANEVFDLSNPDTHY